MNVSLTPELERRIAERFESGRYASASEIVREGLRLLFEAEASVADRRRRLRAEIAVGLDQLDRGETVTGAAALAAVTERLERRRRA